MVSKQDQNQIPTDLSLTLREVKKTSHHTDFSFFFINFFFLIFDWFSTWITFVKG